MVPLTSSALCLLGILMSSSFLGAEALTCAKGWMQYDRSCYAYFDEPMTWAQAEIECQSYGSGSHLVSIHSKTESVLVARYVSFNKRNPDNVFIGLRDVQQNRRWRWSDGSTFNWKAWRDTQPDNEGNNQYCVTLARSTDYRRWNDATCMKARSYVCKYGL